MFSLFVLLRFVAFCGNERAGNLKLGIVLSNTLLSAESDHLAVNAKALINN